MTTLGIICAMPCELDKLITKYNLKKEKTKDIYVNDSEIKKIVVAMSGVGKVNSAIMTQYIIDKYNVDAIITFGVASGLNSNLKVMDVVISEYVTYHDFFPTKIMESYVPNNGKILASPFLTNITKKVIKDMNITNYHYAPMCSGDSFVQDEKQKLDILLRTGAVCVDMESASIAHTCSLNNIPFISIRTIRDMADGGEYLEELAAYKSSEFVSHLVEEIFIYLSKNKLNDEPVYLRVPEIDELDYYESLLKDVKTMSYNSGYNYNLDGYEKETGCILKFDKEKWYSRLKNDKNRYFAYVISKKDNNPVGYINFHFDEKSLRHSCGIVIEYKSRKKGYGKCALKQMLDVAFNTYQIPSLTASIPYNRNDALRLYTKNGFIDAKKDYYVKKNGNNERTIVLKLNKEEYEQNEK